MNTAPRAILLAGALALLPGCLERRVSITSDPPGALVWMNDQEVGRTPLQTGFTFYGVYDVRVRKEGFEPIVTQCAAKSPWYEYPGPDLIATALPMRIRNEVAWHFVLTPIATPDDPREAEEALRLRAAEFRGAMPAPPVRPPTPEAEPAPEQPSPPQR